MVTIQFQLKEKHIPREMKSYSIVGDLISYLRCPLAYRKIKIGNLTPSRPSQLWFGNFLHGVMQDLFYLYKIDVPIPPPLKPTCELKINMQNKKQKINDPPERSKDIDFFDYYKNIKNCNLSCTDKRCLYRICADVFRRLAAQRIFSRSTIMVQSAIFRVYMLLKDIGRELIPLINAAEIPLKGVYRYENKNFFSQEIIHNFPKIPISTFFEVHGIIDVITQIDLKKYKLILERKNPKEFKQNYILESIGKVLCPELNRPSSQKSEELINYEKNIIDSLLTKYNNGFEIILDYKGQERPNLKDSEWESHEWQLRTYKWLRDQQSQGAPVIAGILIYVNEVFLSLPKIREMVKSIKNKETDTEFNDSILNDLKKNKYINYNKPENNALRYARVIRFIDLQDNLSNKQALESFSKTVLKIEGCIYMEKESGNINRIWECHQNAQMCGTCDYRYKNLCPVRNQQPDIP